MRLAEHVANYNGMEIYMKLYVIRHGETDWNKLRRLQGRTNIQLNELGIKLAKETCEGMKNIQIDMVYTSPLDRAFNTAMYVIGDRNIPVIKDERLQEISFGDWEGEISKGGDVYIEKKMKVFFEDPVRFVSAPNGEKVMDVCRRMKEFYQDLINNPEYEDKNILISTHGCASRCFLCNFLEEGDYFEREDVDIWRGCVPKNCSVTIVNVENGIGKIEEMDHIFYEKG